MQRLSGLDAMFLSMETPTNHMHVTGVFVLDPSEAPRGLLVRPGPGHGRPAPESSSAFPAPPRRGALRAGEPALDRGSRTSTLTTTCAAPVCRRPAARAELEAFVGRMIGLPLDRKRPLWEMYLVEGLEGGRQAIVMKMHHSAIDGVSGAELTAAWLDLEADPPADAR